MYVRDSLILEVTLQRHHEFVIKDGRTIQNYALKAMPCHHIAQFQIFPEIH